MLSPMTRTPLLLLLVASITPTLHAADSDVRLNTLGYLPHFPKRATIAGTATEFSVVRTSDGTPVLSAKPSEGTEDPATKRPIAIADFSTLTTPGTYVLRVPGVGDSPPFRIAPDLYHAPFRTVTRTMYLW